MSYAFIISIIFLLIGVITIIFLVCYVIFWKQPVAYNSCLSNYECPFEQICLSGYCNVIKCQEDNNCPNNTICVNSYCTSYRCLIGNDCPTGMACVTNNELSGICVKTGSQCSSNFDCQDLSCVNNICVQCINNNACPTGMICSDRSNSCIYPINAQQVNNNLYYESLAQEKGNITAPPGYMCSFDICGNDDNSKISCDNNSCPSSCPFCIDSVCRCTPGEIYESCKDNSDCISNICDTTSKICIGSGGQCAYNYNGITGHLICPRDSPYCVDGTCSSNSLNARCGNDTPDDFCYNSLYFDTNQNISDQNITGIFCVNGTCQRDSGLLNEICINNNTSCSIINGIPLVCKLNDKELIPKMRCLT